MPRLAPAALLLLASACGTSPTEPVPLDGSWSVDAAGVVVGEARGSDGTGSDGAVITLDPLGYETTSDASGAFRIERVPPGDYTVLAAADGSVGEVEVQVEADAEVEVTVVLQPLPSGDGQLRVDVEGPDGLPLAGAAVRAGGVEGATDAQGLAVLSGLGGEVVTVEIDAPDLWPRSVVDLLVPDKGGAAVAVTLSGRPSEDADPVGIAVCSLCHPDAAAGHGGTRHARAVSYEVSGAFAAAFANGAVVDLGVATATLGSGPSVELDDGSTAVVYTVAGFLGDPEHGSVPWTELSGRAYPLPVAFVAGDTQFPGSPDGDLRLDAFEADRWVDASGLRSGPDATRTAERECFGCHVTSFNLRIAGTDVQLEAPVGRSGRWLDDGITCERCHGNGSEHLSSSVAERPFTITNPAYLDHDRADEVCGQCHSTVASTDTPVAWPWAADGPFWPGEALEDHGAPTGTPWPSGAARGAHAQHDELTLSGHQVTRCASCHDAHGSDQTAQLRLRIEDNRLCTSCHRPLTFGGGWSGVRAHDQHDLYDPSGPTRAGRCTDCHMPPTASYAGYSAWSGGGTLASHLMAPHPPLDTVEVFDAQGATVLDPGEYPVSSCTVCHAWNAWLWDPIDFPGPYGDPGLRATHVSQATWYAEKFP